MLAPVPDRTAQQPGGAPTASFDPLADAYDHCRRINRHFGKTYYFSTALFPGTVRPAVHALYAWVRCPDEWVDNPDGLSVAAQCERLAWWGSATRDALETGTSANPVLAAWADAARRHAVPVAYMEDFLAAMAMDLTVREYATFAHLERYMWGSASVVGLMMCHVVGASDPRAVPHAASLGLAMQLTNFLRDVGEDWRVRGRIYLPLEDLHRYGVAATDIAEARVTDRFRELMRFEIDRARTLYADADMGMEYLPPEARLPIRLARLLYARILDKIEQNDFDVFTRRAQVPTWEKLLVLAREQQRLAAPARD